MNEMLTSTKAPFVGIVVLNYNGIAHVEDCFTSLMKLDYTNAGIVMVDNASVDGSHEYVRQRFPTVHIIRNERNEHFAGGMNRGINHWLKKGVEYIATLNNDVEVDPRWLSELTLIAKSDSHIGAVASRMKYFHNRKIINGIGVDLNLMGYAWDRHQGEIFKKEMEYSEEVISFCAGSVLLNSSALREIGLFNPWHRYYLEDVDLSFRLRSKGWRIVTAPHSIIYHKFSASTKQGSLFKDYYILRNRLKIFLTYLPLNEKGRIALRKVIRKEMGIAYHQLRRGQWMRAWLQMKAFLGCIFALPQIARSRKAYLRQRPSFELLTKSFEPDILPYFRWDYERADKVKPNQNMIIMGYNDTHLGDGWYPLDLSMPQYRWTCDKAEIFLSAHAGLESIVQLHVRQPITKHQPQGLEVFLNDTQLGASVIQPGDWRTLHFKCVPTEDTIKLTLKSNHIIPIPKGSQFISGGLQFNEISLLPTDSPFLRRA